MNKKCKILFAIKTHSQRKEVVKQLKGIKDRVDFPGILSCLSSRNLTCLKFSDEDLKTKSFNEVKTACSELKRNYKCEYSNNMSNSNVVEFINSMRENGIQDIEDIKVSAESCKLCPYYLEKELTEIASIIIFPYNYLTSPYLRSKLPIEDSIIIVDEAHNIEAAAEEGYSLQISQKQIELYNFNLVSVQKKIETFQKKEECSNEPEIEEDRIFSNLSNELLSSITEILNCLKISFSIASSKLMGISNRIKLEKLNGEFRMKNIEFFNIFQKSSADESNFEDLKNKVQILIQFLKQNNILYGVEMNLQNFYEFLQSSLSLYTDFRINSKNRGTCQLSSYKLGFFMEENTIIMKLKCLSPSFCFEDISKRNPHSMIFMSGTLTPFKLYKDTFKIKFDVTLVNEHLIDPLKQIKTTVLEKKIKGSEINFTYETRNETENFEELGYFMIELSKKVKYGVLLVFSSYQAKDNCIEYWRKNYVLKGDSTFLESIQKCKPLFDETQNLEFENSLAKYFIAAKEEKGAILCCIFRGKATEGINYEDNKCRTIVLVGIPYLNDKNDGFIEAKRVFLEENNISYEAWRDSQTFNPVNQAIGRIIRHKEDFGCVVLVDSRYTKSMHHLSNWIIKNYLCSEIFSTSKTIVESLCKFFNDVNNQEKKLMTLSQGEITPVKHNPPKRKKSNPEFLHKKFSIPSLSQSLSKEEEDFKK